MGRNHVIMLVVVAAIFYLVGAKYPAWGTTALSKVGA
jgi:hypothetical protein